MCEILGTDVIAIRSVGDAPRAKRAWHLTERKREGPTTCHVPRFEHGRPNEFICFYAATFLTALPKFASGHLTLRENQLPCAIVGYGEATLAVSTGK